VLIYSCSDPACKLTTAIDVLSGSYIPSPQQVASMMLVTFTRHVVHASRMPDVYA
jgi:hypothetical protein